MDGYYQDTKDSNEVIYLVQVSMWLEVCLVVGSVYFIGDGWAGSRERYRRGK